MKLRRKIAPWLYGLALLYLAVGTWAIFHWNEPLSNWLGFGEVLVFDAVPIPLRMGWALTAFAPAAGLFHLGRWLSNCGIKHTQPLDLHA